MPKTSTLLFVALLMCAFCSAGSQGEAQPSLQATGNAVDTLASADLPDAPSAAFSSSTAPEQSADPQGTPEKTPAGPAVPAPGTTPPTYDPSTTQTKRILGVIPNFRAVSANQKLPAQSPKEKFFTATEDSFDYSSLFLPAVLAGYSQLTNGTPEFHQGAAGYGRYFWHSFVDQTIENYSVEAIVPILTHQDNRYYTEGYGGFLKRSGYALSRVVVTRNDAGHETFNTSEVVGAGMAAGISNLYYPSAERTFGNTGSKWAINVGVDAATFVFKEFWPDINNAFFHTKD